MRFYELKRKIIAFIDNDKFVDSISKVGLVVLDKTCFYSESGGQIVVPEC